MTRNARWRWVSSLGLSTVVALGLTARTSGGQAAPAGDDKPVTFTKDIVPILQRTCQQCHRPNSLAPMSLITYEEVRPYARAMKARTGRRGKQDVMPPWYVEKN